MICTASVEDRVPPFRRNTGKGWVTAEYGMLPRATTTRSQRESSAGKVGGRTQEIQRLIGRSLRSVTKLEEIGERTITLDCDVIQADGGTRTASITGAFVALVLAVHKMREQDMIRTMPITDFVAATSVGIVEGEPMLDLAYTEDSRADVDMNVVKTGGGLYIELQGTAEALPFGREALNRLLDLGDTGMRQLIALQRGLVGQYLEKSEGLSAVRSSSPRPTPGSCVKSARCWRHVPVELITLRDLDPIEEPEETGATFEDNARLKALYYAGTVRPDDGRGGFGARHRRDGRRARRAIGQVPRTRRVVSGAIRGDLSTPRRRLGKTGQRDSSAPSPSADDGRIVYEARGTVEGEIAQRATRRPRLRIRPYLLLPSRTSSTLAEVTEDAEARRRPPRSGVPRPRARLSDFPLRTGLHVSFAPRRPKGPHLAGFRSAQESLTLPD